MSVVQELPAAAIEGREHWAEKGDVRLFLWEKCDGEPADAIGTIVFVHGSSMSAQATFDLQIEGRPDSSSMNWLARRGFDTWCVDMEGYGRSDKKRPINCDIANGADDLEAAIDTICEIRGIEAVDLYGISSGSLRAALYAQRRPDRVRRLILDAFVWTGKGSPTLEARTKKLPQFKADLRRPVDLDFVRSIYTRDHIGCADDEVIEAQAKAITELDDSMPNGTYVDMCENLPLVDPQKIEASCLILRGQYDGIAGMEDLLEFFARLPNPDKQFKMMAGISHASFQLKNHLMVYHMIHAYLTQPDPVYSMS